MKFLIGRQNWILILILFSNLDERTLIEVLISSPAEVLVFSCLQVNTLMVTCSDLNFGNVIRGLKRIPTVVPLVVVVNGEYILSILQLQEFAKKYRTGIVEAHSELVSVLSNPASSLMQALQHEAMTLSTCLDHLAKQQPATVDAGLAVPAVE
jgi:hypothetical protein